MNFLAPLFLIGGAAVAIPIVLHLIRRQTKSQQDFSSIMFLDPTPPIMLRRSRVDQWLMLLLRSLAMLLLVAAFARPYWSNQNAIETPTNNVRRAILLDTSASMQREGIWSSAIAAVERIIRESPPLERLSLFAFDDTLQVLVDNDASVSTSSANPSQTLLSALRTIKPSYRGTNLGLALVTAADKLVHSEDIDKQGEASATTEIIVVTDFQSGSTIDRLENYQWPTNCKVTLNIIESSKPINIAANILLAADSDAIPVESSDKKVSKEVSKTSNDQLRVRLWNYGGMDSTKATLKWLDMDGHTIEGSEKQVDVGAEQATVVAMPVIDAEAVRLHVDGDDAPFDDDRWIAKPPRRKFTLVCLDAQQRVPSESLGYFLEQLPLDDGTREVQFVWRDPGSSNPWPDRRSSPLIVASHDVQESDCGNLRSFVAEGGHALWVLDESIEDPQQKARLEANWAAITEKIPSGAHESAGLRESLFERIDFTHPLFRSLADSRFNDFTKVRFWKHRCLALADDPDWQVHATFDDDFPAIASRRIGEGRLWIIAAGWQPSESQLALSSKFVPIISSIFSQAAPAERMLDSLVVGDRTECDTDERWFDPDGNEIGNIRPVSAGFSQDNGNPTDDKESRESSEVKTRCVVFDRPGFYRMTTGEQTRTVSVNLPFAESDTRVMELDRLERLGVVTSDLPISEQAATKKQQMIGIDTESQQRGWRWLMVAMLVVLVGETCWGMRRA